MTIIGTGAFLRTAEIRVEGVSTYSPQEVVEVSGLSPGDNLIFVNTQTVSQNIRNSLPFVSSVQITKVLPDKVLIEITESTAVASVTFAGEVYIIDSSGRVLARLPVGDTPPGGLDIGKLIEIRGAEIEETAVGNTLRPVFGSETKIQYVQDVLVTLER